MGPGVPESEIHELITMAHLAFFHVMDSNIWYFAQIIHLKMKKQLLVSAHLFVLS